MGIGIGQVFRYYRFAFLFVCLSVCLAFVSIFLLK